MVRKKTKEPTEGEQFIIEYFEDEKISFHSEVKLGGLKNDTKSFRIADFYLPNYKIYVEFNGQWNNSKESRERYREKKKVYEKNKIPCIYLYPENLGIIDYSFQKRMIKELKIHNMKKELFLYQSRMLIMDRGGLFLWLGFALLILGFGDNQWEKDSSFIIFLVGIIIYQIYRLINGYVNFFK